MAVVAERDGWWCVWCGRPLNWENVTLEHWVTMSAQGNHDLDNLRLACAPCNHRRGDVPAATWAQVAIHDLLSVGLYWRTQPETTWIPLRPRAQQAVGTTVERAFGDRPEMHDELGGRVVASMILENGPKAQTRLANIHRRAHAGQHASSRPRRLDAEWADDRWRQVWAGQRPASPTSRRAGRTEID